MNPFGSRATVRFLLFFTLFYKTLVLWLVHHHTGKGRTALRSPYPPSEPLSTTPTIHPPIQPRALIYQLSSSIFLASSASFSSTRLFFRVTSSRLMSRFSSFPIACVWCCHWIGTVEALVHAARTHSIQAPDPDQMHDPRPTGPVHATRFTYLDVLDREGVTGLEGAC